MTEKADCLVQLSERKVLLNLHHLCVNLCLNLGYMQMHYERRKVCLINPLFKTSSKLHRTWEILIS